MNHKRKSSPKMVASRIIATDPIEEIRSTDNTNVFKHISKEEKATAPSPFSSLFFKKQVPSPYTTAAIVIIGLFSIFSLSAKANQTITYISAVDTKISNQSIILALKEKMETIPQENVLYIPKLNVFTDISEGEYEDEKNYASAWRRSHTSTPEEGGNTVVVGHRYRDNTPDYPLYDIDKISQDDELIVYWDGEKYIYTVYETLEVHETAIEIEDDSDESLLTLYACDWSGKRRLVVQAKLQKY